MVAVLHEFLDYATRIYWITKISINLVISRLPDMALDKSESEKDGTGGRAMDRQEAEQVSFSRSPINDAIRHRRSSSRLLLALQRHPEHVQLREPDTYYTYLHLVVAISDDDSQVAMVPMIYQLSNAGIDVDSKDCKDRTALELAMVKGLKVLMVALLRIGSDQTATDYRAIIARLRTPRREVLMDEFDRYTPDIWEAATTGDLGSVHVLINSWCRVKVRRRGLTLLEDLRRRGGSSSSVQAEIISLLASYEMTIEFVHATLAGDEAAMLDILMDECECDVDILDISYVDPETGSLRPRSLRDTAIALNHPGRILQLLSPKCKRYDPSTGIPDTVLYSDSPESDAVADADDIMRRVSHATVPSHHPRLQNQRRAEDLNFSITLSGIEPIIFSADEDSDEDSDTNGLLFCTYRSFNNDDDEDPHLPEVIGKVRGNEGVKDIRKHRNVKDDATIRTNNGGKQQNKGTKLKVTDEINHNGKVRDNARTCGDTFKDSQGVHYYVRVGNDKGKDGRASKRGSEDGQSNTEISRKHEYQYVKPSGANETVEWHQGINQTQRKSGRKSIKSSLCIVS